MKLKAFLEDSFQPAKGSISIPIKGIIDGYRERYKSLCKRAKFSHTIYTIMPGNRTLIHVKVPSETVENFTYDVLLEFKAAPDVVDFRDCDIKIFSNCPSFVYSYAYVFAHWFPDEIPAGNKNAPLINTIRRNSHTGTMLIDGVGILQKIGSRPTKEKPVVRNPMGIPMFDKSLYFAIFHVMDELTWPQVKATHNNINMARILVTIDSFDTLMNNRKRAENLQKRKQAATDKATEEGFKKHEKSITQQSVGIKHAERPLSPKQVRQVTTSKHTTSTPRKPKRIGH